MTGKKDPTDNFDFDENGEDDPYWEEANSLTWVEVTDPNEIASVKGRIAMKERSMEDELVRMAEILKSRKDERSQEGGDKKS